ncbi:hypothetical protein EGM85_11390, partial [Macrococcus caseolyticus]
SDSMRWLMAMGLREHKTTPVSEAVTVNPSTHGITDVPQSGTDTLEEAMQAKLAVSQPEAAPISVESSRNLVANEAPAHKSTTE